MTEQDAIELLKRRKVLSWQGGFGDYDEAEQMAIKALEEISLYKQGGLCLIPTDVFERQCFLLDEYKALGTVEELRVARDKQVVEEFCKWESTESLRERGIQYSSDGLFKPSCNDNEDDFRDWGWIRHFRFCPYCGKRIEVVD